MPARHGWDTLLMHHDDDLTAEFWGTTSGWDLRPERPPTRRRTAGRTTSRTTGALPAVRALREGLAAFKPQRVAGAGHSDRTREHGIVRPDPRRDHPAGSARRDRTEARPTRRVPVADNEVSLAELAGDWADVPTPLHPGRAGQPAIYLDEATAPTPAVPRRRPAPQFVDFDELDDYADFDSGPARDPEGVGRAPRSRRVGASGEGRDGRLGHEPFDDDSQPDAWAEVRPVPAARRWADRVGLGAVDPLIARLGTLALITALLVPLALASRSGAAGGSDDDALAVAAPPAAAEGPATEPLDPFGADEPAAERPAADPGTAGAGPTPTATPEAAATRTVSLDDVAAAETAAATRPAEQPAAEIRTLASNGGQVRSADTSAAAAEAPAATAEVASAGAAAQRSECGSDYTIVAGDSWYRIAEGAEVPMRDLLSANQATIDTVLLPGAEICLPVGAKTPPAPTTTPPTTQAPSTTVAPPTTAAPATTPTTPTTAAPTTTAPSTTVGGPSNPIESVSTAAAQQIIRDVWPDELEERALEIAYRESGWRHDADNGWCCVGLFQIYWSVHKGWLDDFGIHTRADLKDARKNATAALALYERAGGWGPWSTA